MSINAYNKILGYTLERILHYKLTSVRVTNDLKEIKSITEKGLGRGGYNVDLINLIYNIIKVNATESIYENGLKYLLSEITYKDKKDGNNIYTIKQYTITNNYEKEPLINIIVQKDNKSIQQLMAKSNPNDLIFPESERNIEIVKITPYINGDCGSVFTSYNNKKNNSLLMEQYLQFYPISNNSNQGLLYLCGVGEHTLEIIYSEKQPIYANFTDSKDNIIAGYDANTQLGAKFVLDTINDEVNAIVDKINYIFDNYEKKHNGQKCLKKQ